MRAPTLALPVLALALAGCASPELDPMAMACEDARVQQAGWCGGALDLSGSAAGGAGAAAPQGPALQRTAEAASWTLQAKEESGRHTFAWDSPGRVRLSWQGLGAGDMAVMVQGPGGTVYESRSGQVADSETLASSGPLTIAITLNNYRGEAKVELRAA
jgi:hypothetical protein